MKLLHSLACLALVLISGKVHAREAVISSYELTSAPSDKILGGTAVHIEGFAEAIAEACEATRSAAKLVLTESSGKVMISAEVSPRFVARRVPCALVAADFEGLAFAADFELTAEQMATAELSNVKKLAAQLLLSAVLDPESVQEDEGSSQVTGCESIEYFNVMCTMEYKPTTCRYGDVTVSAGNPCMTRGRIQKQICESEGLFAPEELTCSSGEAI